MRFSRVMRSVPDAFSSSVQDQVIDITYASESALLVRDRLLLWHS